MFDETGGDPHARHNYLGGSWLNLDSNKKKQLFALPFYINKYIYIYTANVYTLK